MPRQERDDFLSDLGFVEEEVRSGVDPSYANKKDTHWDVWVEYCRKCCIDPFLHGTEDPIPYLQVFARRYHDGRVAPRGKPVKSKTVSDALCSVGQRFANLGADDPRLNRFGKLEFRLARQKRCYLKNDTPVVRVKPLPICVILAVVAVGLRSTTAMAKSIANMICIAFFFCLRPGEYTGTTTDDQAFCLNDVVLYSHERRLSNEFSPDHDLLAATHVTYCFTTQKNMNNGQIIAHARSGHQHCCPVIATVRQLLMHRAAFLQFDKPYKGSTKIASYYLPNGKNIALRGDSFTKCIRNEAAGLRSRTGVDPSEYSARSLRAGGAMALLSANCDSNVIKLLGRWKSDAMMDYLHEQSLPIFKRLATAMFNNGQHFFLPSEVVPAAA